MGLCYGPSPESSLRAKEPRSLRRKLADMKCPLVKCVPSFSQLASFFVAVEERGASDFHVGHSAPTPAGSIDNPALWNRIAVLNRARFR